MIADTAHLVVGMLVMGTGFIFFSVDRSGGTSRALALCLAAVGLSLLLETPQGPTTTGLMITMEAIGISLEVLAMFTGVEWCRRIVATGSGPGVRLVNWQLRISQALFLVYGLLVFGYLILRPDLAASDAEGVVKVRPVEFAIFAPVVGTATLLAGIAIVIVMFLQIDSAEKTRLRSIFLAGPFFLLAMVVSNALEPVAMAIGLLMFTAGGVRYLMIQGQRGQFMSQFLSPQVAELVRSEGLDRVLQRERRALTVVACDLRGFTAFARNNSSDHVVEILERYYDAVGEIAARHGGTIKDHAGDGVLILVGAPLPLADHASHGVRLAQEIAAQIGPMLRAVAPGVGLGVGVATGRLTIGAIRGAGRLEYVAVGNAVNLAARLCDRAADGEVLCDRRTLESLGADEQTDHQEREPEPLKGYAEPVPIVALGVAKSQSAEGLAQQAG